MMKIYVFENIYGVVAKVKKPTMELAEQWFKETYPHKTYSCIYEQ